MMFIYIGSIEFPISALNEMQYVRNIYQKDKSVFIPDPEVSSLSILAMREFMMKFPERILQLSLPREKPIVECIDEDIWEWFSSMDIESIINLHYDAYTLGYNTLFEYTSLILSESLSDL